MSRRKTSPIAVVAVWSSAVVKKRATSEFTSSIAEIRSTNCALEGQAMSASCLISVRLGPREPFGGKTSNRRARMITFGSKTTQRERIDAQAAPIMPMRGMPSADASSVDQPSHPGAGPGPKMKRTARTRFSALPATSSATGVFAEPSARWMFVSWSRK